MKELGRIGGYRVVISRGEKAAEFSGKMGTFRGVKKLRNLLQKFGYLE